MNQHFKPFSVQLILLLALVTMAASSCKKDQFESDENTIKDYLAANNLTAERTEEGLYYIITRVGTGDNPTVGDKVTIHYKGYLTNGNIFDSSYDRGEKSTFSLANLIEGWKIGLPLLKEGGSGTLLIPSSLGYGDSPPSGSIIGENEVLLFDIELFEIQ